MSAQQVENKLNEVYTFEELEFLHETFMDYVFNTENGLITVGKESKEILSENGSFLGQLE